MKRVVLMLLVLALVLCVGCNTLVPPETSGVSGSVTTTTTLSTAAQSTVSVLTTTTTQTMTTTSTPTVETTSPSTTVAMTSTTTTGATTSTTSKYTGPTYPPPDSFSSAEYSPAYKQLYSAVSSASLYKSGVPHELATDDPRLIRLMNVIAYAIETGQYGRVLGLATMDEVAQAVHDTPCMVEVIFEEMDEFSGTYKLIIVGDWIYRYIHPDFHSYSSYLDEQGNQMAHQDAFDVDLLTYAGF